MGHAGVPVPRGAGGGGRERDPCEHAAELAPGRGRRGARARLPRACGEAGRREPGGRPPHRRAGGLEGARRDGGPLAPVRPPGAAGAREGARGLDRRGRRRRHLPQLRVPALRGRPAAAPVPRRRLPVARPRGALPLPDPGAARDHQRRRGRLAEPRRRSQPGVRRMAGPRALRARARPVPALLEHEADAEPDGDPRHVRRPAGGPVRHVRRPSLGHAAAEGGRARGQRLRRVAQVAHGRASRSVEVPAWRGQGVPGAARPRGRLLPASRRRGAAACLDRGRGGDRRVDREGGPRSRGRPRRRARPLRAAAHG